MRFLTLVVLLLSLFVPRAAQADSLSVWHRVGDRYWAVYADVQYPSNMYIFYTPASNSYATVAHSAAYENRLQAATQAGLSTHYYNLKGIFQRFETRNNWWYQYTTQYRYPYLPSPSSVISGQGPTHDIYRFWNPTTPYYYSNVPISPSGEWHYADATCDSVDQHFEFRIYTTDRVFYQVRQ